eukprot:scaffold614422_cov90-Attheya_sp.AAC.1
MRRGAEDAEISAENERKLKEIMDGERLWKSSSLKNMFDTCIMPEESVGGCVKSQYRFMRKGYKIKPKKGDHAKQAIKGETLFFGYDALWRWYKSGVSPLVDDQ